MPPKIQLPPSDELLYEIRRRRKPMETEDLSVGIVAACENGMYAVCATDGALSYGQQSADVHAPKATFWGDWSFLFAGKLSSTELIFEEMRQLVRQDETALARENIEDTVLKAYNNRVARWSAIRHLAPFGMDMETFKNRKDALTEKVAAELERTMYRDYQENFSDELAVVGWGKMPLSVTIYSINSDGDAAHAKEAMCAIGSGRDAAISTLLLLEHKLSSRLGDAIFAVAAAKFSSEAHGIGKSTTMWVTRQRRVTDSPDNPPGFPDLLINLDEITKLRELWESYGKPKMPEAAYDFVEEITVRTKDEAVAHREELRRFAKLFRR